jgi:hypothetical protein
MKDSNSSRDFCIFMWGSILSSMWWAMFMFDGLPIGVNKICFLYIFTPMVTLFSVGYFIKELFKSAFSKDEDEE